MTPSLPYVSVDRSQQNKLYPSRVSADATKSYLSGCVLRHPAMVEYEAATPRTSYLASCLSPVIAVLLSQRCRQKWV